MHPLVAEVRPYLEILSFASTIGLTVGLAFTYKQLALLKADVLNRSRRAAAEHAVEAADLYFRDYVSLAGVYFDAANQKKLRRYAGPIGDFSSNSIPKELLNECATRYAMREWLPALNRLESISARLTTGVADEEVAFKIFGRTFCGTVEDYYDLIAFSRGTKANEYWENIVELYKIWRPRLTKAELNVAREQLDAKLSSLPSKSISPI